MILNSNTNRHFLSAACLICASFHATGQTDTLEMDVTFVGSRQMEVRDAVKLSSWPSAKALSSDKPQLSYELLSKRLQFTPVMTPVEATRLRVDPALSRLYRGYVRGAVGTRGTTLLDASFTDLRSRDGSWGALLHHAATNSPSSLLTGRINENSLDAWASRFIGKEKVSVRANAGRNRVLLYGFDSLGVDDDLRETSAPAVVWSHERVQANFKSHHKDSTAFNHSANLSLGWMRNNRDTRERSVTFDVSGTQFFGELKGQLDLEVQLDRYGFDSSPTFNQAIVAFEPSASARRGPFAARAGLGMAIDADQPTRDGLGDAFHLYPRAEVSVNLLRNLFVPYASIGGELQANNFHALTHGNPFFAPRTLTTTSVINNQPVNFDGFRSTNKRLALKGGVRGTITSIFRFHGFFSTAQYEDFVLFRPTFENDTAPFAAFQAVYDTVGVRTLGGEAEFDLGRAWSFSGGFKLHRYNVRTEDRAWNLPNVTWSAAATYMWIEGLSITADATYVGERYSITRSADYGENTPLDNGNFELRMPRFVDFNLTGNYTYNDRLGGWLTLANLTNAKYETWGGFPVQGFQVLGGVNYAF